MKYQEIIFVHDYNLPEGFDSLSVEEKVVYLAQWDFGTGEVFNDFRELTGLSGRSEDVGKYIFHSNVRLGYCSLFLKIEEKEGSTTRV